MRSGRELEDGAVGELAVKSRYISPGYWRDPERTQARFLPDPTGTSARIYLTGDLGMRRADGLPVSCRPRGLPGKDSWFSHRRCGS